MSDLDMAVRIFNIVVASVIIVVGTIQIRRWVGFPPQERLHWMSTAFLNLVAFVGSIESLRGGYPGGLRVWILAVALSWLLAAVCYQPVCRWKNRKSDKGGPCSGY